MSLAAFKYRDFRYFTIARFITVVAHLMLTVAVGQYIYEVTHSPLHLGLTGLALFLPKFGLALVAGHTADRFDRRTIILMCRIAQFLVVVGLILFAAFGGTRLEILYGLLLVMGSAHAFDGPASQSLLPHLVPEKFFEKAVAWNMSLFQVGLICGPALGGWMYGLFGRALPVFYAIALLRILTMSLIYPIRTRTGRLEKSEMSWKSLLAGIHYVREKKLILGAISLDLFAVLFGGATALMPFYANDILHVGPKGLGVLRAVPAVGAALMALLLARHPPQKRTGVLMFIAVTFFGLATILFGISTNFIFSLVCLFVLGVSDMVSVVIRGVLVQRQTPSHMRGRVSAVNFVFIGASNELGEFESGLTAQWFGVVPAVMIGGLGTLAVVALWAWKFPELRRYEGGSEKVSALVDTPGGSL